MKVKITKKRIEQIISEEVEKFVKEQKAKAETQGEKENGSK